MNVVVFIGSSRQLIGWAQSNAVIWDTKKSIEWQESCIDRNRVATYRKMAIELALCWETLTSGRCILTFYSSDDSWKALDENVQIFNCLFQGYSNILKHTISKLLIFSAFSVWANEGTCSVTCGDGLIRQTRTCIRGPCNPLDLTRFIACNNGPCSSK